jgi:hypothetical protein
MTPLEDFTQSGPVTEERANRATEWLVHHALEIGQARGARERAEYLIKIAEARVFMATPGPQEARRMAARASQEYQSAVDEYTDAVTAHEVLVATKSAGETLVDVYRTTSANQRRT